MVEIVDLGHRVEKLSLSMETRSQSRDLRHIVVGHRGVENLGHIVEKLGHRVEKLSLSMETRSYSGELGHRVVDHRGVENLGHIVVKPGHREQNLVIQQKPSDREDMLSYAVDMSVMHQKYQVIDQKKLGHTKSQRKDDCIVVSVTIVQSKYYD